MKQLRSLGLLQSRAAHSLVDRRIVLPLQRFVNSQEIAGAALMLAAVVALIWANSPWSASYFSLWEIHLGFYWGDRSFDKSLHHWINDGLMTIFFLQVGLELKNETVDGSLSGIRKALLPAIAAAGGMFLPAVVYLAFNSSLPNARGWAIPVATDIAFALSVLAVAGRGLAPGVRVFLLALAAVDDLGAILIIAVFYTQQVNFAPLLGAGVCIAFFFGMKALGLRGGFLWLAVSVALWFMVLLSGVHATIAGVILGLIAPTEPSYRRTKFARRAGMLVDRFRRAMETRDHDRGDVLLGRLEELTIGTESPLDRTARQIRHWVSYLVLPLFALSNSGVRINWAELGSALMQPVTLGVIAGLVVGKPVGCFVCTWAAVRLRITELPPGMTMAQVAGVSVLAGIGFTVSLFVTGLAFPSGPGAEAARVGILFGSAGAALLGLLFFRVQRSGDVVQESS